MEGAILNPYALHVYCDGAMDYDSRNTGGVGIEVKFPEHLNMPPEEFSIGRYQGANIERLEIEALIQAFDAVINLFREREVLQDEIKTIIFKTDRHGLIKKTNPYAIREWRSKKWHNHEGKPIKNEDLLDKLDKLRLKLNKETRCNITIEYGRRKYNKRADKLAKAGKNSGLINDSIAVKGQKIGKRKFDGEEIKYSLISVDALLDIRIFRKDPVGEEWEVWAELCEGPFIGSKLKIYMDNNLERLLKRHHVYRVKVSEVSRHHLRVAVHFEEILLPSENKS